MQRFEDIRNWAHDRNLIKGSTSTAQYRKLLEEVTELYEAMFISGGEKDYADAIGDIMVVLTIMASQEGITSEYCLDVAWNEIKDRKGKMINGIFVKDE